MKAVLFEDGAPRLVERPMPRPVEGEALVRVLLAGICRTDLEIARGYLAHEGVPGHEFVGVVERSSSPALVGRRVVGEINVPCRSCPTCGAGRPRHCPSRTVLGIDGRDGAFAEYLTLPDANLHDLGNGIPDEAAVSIEPLAAAYEVLEQVPEARSGRSAIVGDGRLARLCARVLVAAGASPDIWGKHNEKLTHFRREGLRTRVGPPGPERPYDLVLEASGSPSGFDLALRLVRPCGIVVLKSTYHGAAPFDMAPVVIDEIRVVGSRCGPFAPALAHVAAEPSYFASIVTGVLPLRDVAEAFRRASSNSLSKILLDPRR